MKAGWEIKTLGEVYDVRDGTHDSPKYVEIGYPLITSKNLKYKGLSFDNVQYIAEEDYKKINARSAVHKGDVLFAMIGTIGNPTIVEIEPSFAIKNVALFKVPQVHSSGFLKYYLETEEVVSKMVSEAKGTTQKFVGLGYLRNFPIKIPALTEQQRIVAILDQAFEGITKARANAEQNLQNARALFESHLQSLFTLRGEGWIKNKLDSLTTKIGSGATPRGGEESYKTEGISLVRSMNVHDFGFKYTKLAFLDDAQAKELSNVELKSNDVLLNITGASVARCCIVPDDVLPARVNQHVSIIRPIAEKLDSSYLHYLLLSKPYKDKLLQTGSEGGSTRQAITKAQIQEFVIEYPPAFEDQKTIVHKLDEMLKETQRLEALYQRKIKLLDELKKSLLQQAFAGEL
jgi:type I restriction enzyme S subunit